MQENTALSWNTYAQSYDMLFTYNPFYQQLHQEVMQEVGQWKVAPGSLLADIGAGTGNYSLAMARLFPQATVLHFDRDEGMNGQAAKKKNREALFNHQIITCGIDDVRLERASLRGLISVHALYTFPDPTSVLRNMYEWLQPGGDAVLVNAGRMVNVLDWQIAIGYRLISKYGFRKTLSILQQGKEVSRQNAYVREMQRKGIFWTHNHREFNEAVESAGFKIIDSRTCFRGISDFVVARKEA
ncbi:MAG: class I SAM-dependent methyltransferase [Lewinellaceae bacterium]|nr:class I SAM-dependent methyltransferase [Lewinellaceae bacterium]